ncbi:MAG: cupin domain-containing protein [Gammaproteobacteria bacterium]
MDDIAAELIERFDLQPHPEGGHYRRIHESKVRNGARPAVTGIRFLLARGEASRWHRVDGDECWHWQQGGVLELLTLDAHGGAVRRQRLGPYGDGVEPMRVVPAGVWQAARPLGDFALVACTVSPGFAWEGFALMAPDDPLATPLRWAGVWFD